MKRKDIFAVSGGVILLILAFTILLKQDQRGKGVNLLLRPFLVAAGQTDMPHINAGTNSKPLSSVPEESCGDANRDDLLPSPQADGLSSNNHIFIAGGGYPIIFEEDNLPAELKRTIIADLTLNLSHLERIHFIELPSEEEEPAAQMYQNKVTHWLDDGPQQQRYFPDSVEKFFGGAVKTGNTFQLIIHEKLIEEYKAALIFRNSHEEMFNMLDAFVKMLSNRESIRSLAEGDVGDIRSLMYFCGRPPPISDEEYKRDIRSWDLWVRPPSLLEVKPLGDMVCQGAAMDTDIYAFSTLVSNAEREPEYLRKMPIGVFINGVWHILVMPSP